jgi:hypothetical protein
MIDLYSERGFELPYISSVEVDFRKYHLEDRIVPEIVTCYQSMALF